MKCIKHFSEDDGKFSVISTSTFVYIDDILIYSDDTETNSKHLGQVFF